LEEKFPPNHPSFFSFFDFGNTTFTDSENLSIPKNFGTKFLPNGRGIAQIYLAVCYYVFNQIQKKKNLLGEDFV
jgi:hypothetical protein